MRIVFSHVEIPKGIFLWKHRKYMYLSMIKAAQHALQVPGAEVQFYTDRSVHEMLRRNITDERFSVHPVLNPDPELVRGFWSYSKFLALELAQHDGPVLHLDYDFFLLNPELPNQFKQQVVCTGLENVKQVNAQTPRPGVYNVQAFLNAGLRLTPSVQQQITKTQHALNCSYLQFNDPALLREYLEITKEHVRLNEHLLKNVEHPALNGISLTCTLEQLVLSSLLELRGTPPGLLVQPGKKFSLQDFNENPNFKHLIGYTKRQGHVMNQLFSGCTVQ